MMAKMFYTIDETRTALGKNEEEIKQFVREGRLREFRDGPRLMFKADQVETLKNQIAGGGGSIPAIDQVDLGPSDSGAPIGLIDSKGASGSAITLADSDMGGRTGGQVAKDDTALAADLGLSGSVGGVPSPGRVALHGSQTGTRVGINIFSPEEVEAADPAAQTSISQGTQDQINLEGVGSGSGLLDLTRESDDTSLGAAVLDEISPGAASGKSRTGAAGMSGTGPGIETLAEPRGGVIRGAVAGPVLIEAPDPLAPAFAGAALGAAFVVLFGIFVILSSAIGAKPEFVQALTRPSPQGYGWNIWILFGIGAIVSVAFFLVGLFLGKRR